jgi:tRNA threonylcarbamoyladenosine biosynthesis protein TsaB
VRIGIGIAQGLAFGANLPMIGISTLQMMAQGAVRSYDTERIVAAIDARMGEIYTAEFTREPWGETHIATLVGEEKVIKPDLVEYTFDTEETYEHYEVFGVGTGWGTYEQILTEKVDAQRLIECDLPQAHDMLLLAEYALANNLQVMAEDAQPVYVRDTVSWKKLPGK